MTYRMQLTEEQYNHIIRCVEVVHRISCGDIYELRDILPICPDDILLKEIKRQSFPELAFNEQYGWNGGYRGRELDCEYRQAFDKFQAQGYQIYRQMRRMRNIAGGIEDVYSSPTLTTWKAEQPVIEIIR